MVCGVFKIGLFLCYLLYCLCVAIRVDISATNGQIKTVLLSHDDMEKSVGDAIAFFARQLLFQDPTK